VTLVGIVGGGQLGRMLALAGHPLGIRCRVLDPSPDPPAAGVAEVIRAEFDDQQGLRRLADGATVVTFELEHVPIGAVKCLEGLVRIAPGVAAIAAAQDRLVEKHLFTRLGIPVAPFAAVDDESSLMAAVATLGLPLVVKTRFAGYDGRGQRVLRSGGDVAAAHDMLSGHGLVAERLLTFRRELSLLAVRGVDGGSCFYAMPENTHRAGILRVSRAPVEVAADRVAAAQIYASRLVDELGYVGVLALELFETDDGLVANELAPRVHNSGHWTIEGATTSQFENHLRAVCGLPLGSPAARGAAAMVNLIGREPDSAALLALPNLHLHRYGKTARAHRKLGHVTIAPVDEASLGVAIRLADDAAAAAEQA
jgi:5-(carboxyamino)imidazole ribonucleotide synthase